MAKQEVRMFSAERDLLAQRHKETSLGEVMEAIQSLEDNIAKTISTHIKNLEERLEATNVEAAAEVDDKTQVEEIMAEIHAMNDHITATKHEIAALKPEDDGNTTISTATEELAEVVKATEEAANEILENAEQIDGVVSNLRSKVPEGDPDEIGPDVDKLEFISINLLTACSFQDITGQRINKVVNSLNYIEERLQKMIEIWRVDHGTADLQGITFAKNDHRDGKNLLHGPQSSDGTGEGAMDQDAINAMFD
ncbi:MAG: hypothetical protein O3A85_01685 [Proteobacteria bacterium]|nr:hypothetical protein [Pseudomonadota bacterium]